MSRDQRVRDNHGLLHAASLAVEAGAPLVVVFALKRRCGAASRRSFDFMLDGLREVERDLSARGIAFELALGAVHPALDRLAPRTVVCDFSPLRGARSERAELASQLDCPLIEVDSRNIVPAWVAADKHVYAAFHLRNRYRRLLPQFLVEPETLPQVTSLDRPKPDWDAAAHWVAAEEHGPQIETPSGEAAAHSALAAFVDDRLVGYAEQHGRPDVDHQSGLSPYLHFGQLSALRAVIAVKQSSASPEDIAAFIDQAVVWRELSDNYCLNVDGYATLDGLAGWARTTIDEHAADARDVVYDLDAFESADTHDPIWNAAQLEMVRTGRMHNYMRMYWAKKILEWSESPAEAMRIAVLLNDRYELDGRDSNGYAGIAWSIGGVHDRPWKERAVYGKIRYMNDRGARRKFDVDAYIRRVAPELLGEQRL